MASLSIFFLFRRAVGRFIKPAAYYVFNLGLVAIALSGAECMFLFNICLFPFGMEMICCPVRKQKCFGSLDWSFDTDKEKSVIVTLTDRNKASTHTRDLQFLGHTQDSFTKRPWINNSSVPGECTRKHRLWFLFAINLWALYCMEE